MNTTGEKLTCYDDQTEVMTDRGFVAWEDVNEDTKLAVFDPADAYHIGFEKPKRLIKSRHNGAMYTFTGKVNLSVTPSHYLYASWSSDKEVEHNPAYSLVKANKPVQGKRNTAKPLAESKIRMRIAAEGTNNETATVSIAMCRFIGFFIGDGYADKNEIVFHIIKERKIKFLKQLCIDNNIELRERKNDAYAICDKGLATRMRHLCYTSKDKTMPDMFFRFSQRHISALLDGLLNSDGSNRNRGYCDEWLYYTSSIILKDKLQALFSMSGHPCSVSEKDGMYRIMHNTRTSHPHINNKTNTNCEVTEYNGYVYCAEVSSGLLLVRRGNRTVLSGNSPLEAK